MIREVRGPSPFPRAMEKTQFRQCVMRRKLPDGSVEVHTAFLPTSHAKVGKTVDLDFGSERRAGFKVESVGEVRTIEDVDRWRENHKRFEWVLGD